MLFLVAHGGGAFEILVLDGPLLLGLDLLDVGFQTLDLRRAGHGADAGAGAGFVHQINGFVRQVTIGDVAVGKLDRGFDGLVSELGFVVLLVFGTKPLEDEDGFLDGGSFDFDGLEAAFQGGIFLDVLAILGERGGADALEFTAAEGRLDDIGGVHGAFG